jgi:hypothetical protein
VTYSNPRRMALMTLVVGAALTACGGSSTGSPSATAAPVSTPTAAVASAKCPAGTMIGTALGISLPNATVITGSGSTPFPAGATALACEYRGVSDNVLIELIANISPSYIAQFSGKFPVGFKSVSGVGDQARSFSQALGGGKDNEGVVATKGSTIVAIVATDTPASLTQIEALVNQLL